MLLIPTCTSLLLKSLSFFDTVDRGILERVLSSLGLSAWFCHAYFEFHHAHVRVRFNVATGLGEPWTRGWKHSSGLPAEYDVYSGFVLALV